ncbi:type IV pilus modification protein PilV [Exilibacterium tricleocarpae]|nr:type IV pilus modification protein PilV [Exilibacterium tricleocarpae]
MRKSAQAGAGLIEVMVSMFILAVGLLGVLAMQANGVKSNQRAYFSTEAQLLAGDMVDRIFAYNSINLATDNGDYNGIDTSEDDPNNQNCIDTAGGCSAAQQVQYDIWDWRRQLTSRLPGGVGTVAFDAARGVYTITVMWDQELTGAAGTGCGGTADDLTCYQLEVRL